MSPAGKTPLIPEQRHQELLRLLRASGVLSIHDLTAALDVSHMTVRRDIAALEKTGQVVSVQGGVRLADRAGGTGGAGHAPPRERATRAALEIPRKQAIARRAADLVRDGMVVYLDAGTTCQSVVPFLVTKAQLTVVTNDFHAALALFELPDVHIVHTGGEVDPASAAGGGPLAARAIEGLNIDLCLLGAGAWDLVHGVTSHSTDKVLLKQTVLKASSAVALLADSTKWGSTERFTVTQLDRLDTVVTDTGLPREVTDRIAQEGPEVLRAH